MSASKIAEAFFKRLNKNKKNKTKSAGLICGYPVDKRLKDYARKNGIKIGSSPRTLTKDIVRWADLIILVADNVPKSVFKSKKIQVWRINDCSIEEDEKVNRIIKQIKGKIIRLLEELS